MGDLFNLEPKSAPAGPVECLGMTFPNDEERRKHFLGLLREKLKDPEFRKIEGFPIGSDEDILALSDPPFYTACPNPFIADFIKHFGKPYDPSKPYSREPFATDVSEGKNDPIYNAHSYHTKVPHKAIMRYILHYTEPGDVVFDGFCGTGMTGVAALLCGNRSSIESLGYRVADDGQIKDANGGVVGRIGGRRPILSDLAPAATFISSNYCDAADSVSVNQFLRHTIKRTKDEIGWMYISEKTPSSKSDINFTIWSDVFFCPQCQGDIIFWEAARDEDSGEVQDTFPCPHCSAILKKASLDRQMETALTHHGVKVKRIKKFPIALDSGSGRGRSTRPLSSSDHEVLQRVARYPLPKSCPTLNLNPDSEQYKRDALHLRGIVSVSDFYTRRNLVTLGRIWDIACSIPDYSARKGVLFILTSCQWLASQMYRYRSGGGGGQQGKLTIPSLQKEQNPLRLIADKARDISQAWNLIPRDETCAITTGSATDLHMIPSSSVDYIFTDPPFGGNLFYADLNSIWEGWLRVITNDSVEAVVHRARTVNPTTLTRYGRLMAASFAEAYRLLKPGRWITVEFHNSSNAVWNAIQQSLTEAGFVVADIRTLDKKQGTFKQVTESNAVKQDLIISAYKPNGGLEDRFRLSAGTEDGLWDFVRTHLKQLPVFVAKDGQAEVVAERQNYLIFDRMVAFHVQHGVTVPMSAAEFYAGLVQRFSERDGMYFLPEQVAEYDKKRMTVREVLQLQLFVTDESSAIQWLRQQLLRKPQTAGDLKPQFMQEIGGWQKTEKLLELDELLEQNFLRYDGKGEVPNQIHSYLSTNFKELRNLPKDDESLRAKGKDRWYVPDPNKAGDLEKLRERSLLKEFEDYRTSSQKRLKVFRLEAVRAGFKKAWQDRDYATIITVARKVPENVLQEDPKLLMWYDQAITRMGGE